MQNRAPFEPPAIPTKWTDEERRYAVQLEEALVRMGARLAKLEEQLKTKK